MSATPPAPPPKSTPADPGLAGLLRPDDRAGPRHRGSRSWSRTASAASPPTNKLIVLDCGTGARNLGLQLLGLTASAQLMWTALVLIAAVTVDALTRRGRSAGSADWFGRT